MIEYKGYMGEITFDDKAHIFHGEVINIKDVITFQGKSVEELEKAFKDSIDDYLLWCKEDGLTPEKPYSGKFNLRISPELHRELSILAIKQGISLNKLIEQTLLDDIEKLKNDLVVKVETTKRRKKSTTAVFTHCHS